MTERRFALLSRVAALGAITLAAARPALANYGGELRELYRGFREMGMGGAYVAVADDEEALFLNPAGLAGIKKTQIHLVTLDVEASNDIVGEALSGFPTLAALGQGMNSISGISNLNKLVGKNIYARAQATGSVLIPNFGFGFISDHQLATIIKDQVWPNTTIGIQSTNGIQGAMAFAFSPRSKRKSFGELRIGIGAKMLWRRGGYMSMSPLDLYNLSLNYLYSLPGSYGFGWGMDLGLQYILPLSRKVTFQLGSAYTEAGDIAFTNGADAQKGNLSTGIALKYKSQSLDFTYALDYRHMLEDTDWRKRLDTGFEVSLPLLNIYGGLHQLNPSYGVSFDIWLLKVTGLTYIESRGVSVGQDDERRWLSRIELKLGF